MIQNLLFVIKWPNAENLKWSKVFFFFLFFFQMSNGEQQQQMDAKAKCCESFNRIQRLNGKKEGSEGGRANKKKDNYKNGSANFDSRRKKVGNKIDKTLAWT